MYYSIHTYQSTESTKITGETSDSRPKMELASSYQYFVLQTVFGYIAFEKQIQQHFSKCESYLRERERERERDRETERERERPVEREGARREFDVSPSLIDWLQSLKQFFTNVSYHILVASLTLMALF